MYINMTELGYNLFILTNNKPDRLLIIIEDRLVLQL